jgi:hypothetical protein
MSKTPAIGFENDLISQNNRRQEAALFHENE